MSRYSCGIREGHDRYLRDTRPSQTLRVPKQDQLQLVAATGLLIYLIWALTFPVSFLHFCPSVSLHPTFSQDLLLRKAKLRMLQLPEIYLHVGKIEDTLF